jgi:hypothetical protein
MRVVSDTEHLYTVLFPEINRQHIEPHTIHFIFVGDDQVTTWHRMYCLLQYFLETVTVGDE